MATKTQQPARLDDLLVQLKLLNRITVLQLKNTLKQMELIRLLASTGASNREIADVLDTTPDTVKVTLGRLKKSANSGEA